MSRSSESLLPKREYERVHGVLFKSSPRQGISVLGEEWSCPSENKLAQARLRGGGVVLELA